jgi:ABC-type glycerol-3-phosphate transport system substrate-binding protein
LRLRPLCSAVALSTESGKDATFAAAQREAAAERAINMSYWLPGSAENAAAVYDRIFSEFRAKNPGVQMELTQVPWSRRDCSSVN